jgi:hypothetical protein
LAAAKRAKQCADDDNQIACVAEWHSKFHAAARGIEATLLKKRVIR